MPFLAGAAPLIGLAGGLLGSAFGKSGGQGGQTQSTTGSTSGVTKGTTTTGGRNVLEQFEDPSLSPFRDEFMGGLSDELEFAKQPVYGEEAQAGFLNQLNSLTNQASGNITNRLAATGGLRSGSAEDQLTDLELARGGEASRFFSELPFKEREARLNATLPLLQTGLGFAGRGVTNQVGTTDQTTTGLEESNRTSEGFAETDVEGPGFWRSLAGAGGSLLGGLLGNNPSDPFAPFKRKPTESSIGTSEIPLGAGRGQNLDEMLRLIGSNPIQFGR